MGIYLAFGAAIALPVEFFLPKMTMDPLFYFLMVKSILAGKGHALVLAENMAAPARAYGVSYVYALAAWPFTDYAAILRSIQATNFVVAAACLGLWFYYIARSLPALRPITFAILAVVVLIDARWQRMVALPNADLLPSLLTIVAILVARPLLDGALRSPAAWLIRGGTVLLVAGLGFFVKMSVVTVALAVPLAMAGRTSRRTIALAGAGVVGGMVLVVAANHMVVAEYLQALLSLYHRGATTQGIEAPIGSLLANLVFSGFPSRVIPNLWMMFQDGAQLQSMAFHLASLSLRTVGAMLVGAAVSGVILAGVPTLWRRHRLELLLLLVVLPVFALVPNSTVRYLVPYQPVIWLAFLAGLEQLRGGLARRQWGWLAHWRRWSAASRLPLLAVTAFFVLGLAVVEANQLRLRFRGGLNGVALIGDVSSVYREVEAVLAAIPADNARIVYVDWAKIAYAYDPNLGSANWLAVSAIPQRVPDAQLVAEAGHVRTLAVFTCEKSSCPKFDEIRDATFDDLRRLGSFRFEPMLVTATGSARGEVYRLVPTSP